MSETDAKACRHAWTDRCKLGRRLEDALRCTECGRIEHWYRLHKEQSARLARYETALRLADIVFDEVLEHQKSRCKIRNVNECVGRMLGEIGKYRTARAALEDK